MNEISNAVLLELGNDGPEAFRARLNRCSVFAETIGSRLSATRKVFAVVPEVTTIERALQTDYGGFTRPYMPHGTDDFDACVVEWLVKLREPSKAVAFLSIECWLDRELSRKINRKLVTERYFGDDVVHYAEIHDDPMRAFQSVTRGEVYDFTIGIALSAKMPFLDCPPGTQVSQDLWHEALAKAVASYASAYDDESWLIAEFP